MVLVDLPLAPPVGLPPLHILTLCGSKRVLFANGPGAMRQRKLGSHTPPCHRRMVITTLFGPGGGGG